MKKLICAFSLVFSAFNVYSQEIIKETPLEITFPKDDVRQLEENLTPPDPQRPELHFVNPYYREPLDNPVPMEFQNMKLWRLYHNFSFSITGEGEIWPGITTINNAMFDLNYNTDIVNFNLGTSLWKMDGKLRPNSDIVFYGNASINPVSWLTVGAYGQYSVMSVQNFKKHGFVLPAPMMPYTSFGVNSRIMFNETFGIEGGFGGQFDPVRRKWEPTYSIGPSFNFNRIRKKK